MTKKQQRRPTSRMNEPPAQGVAAMPASAARKVFFVVAGLLVFAVVVIAALVIYSRPAEEPAATVDLSRLVRPHSPTLGDANAKVHIVEFFDPACGTCRDFYPLVKNFLAANPGRIRLSVRYAAFHRGSDEVVKLLEAARKQGKYWEALEAVLAAQPRWVVNHTAQPELALSALAGLGLDLNRLRREASSPELAQIVQQDMQDAILLGVTKTPEFFVNGRPMPRFGYEELQGLVEQALREAYR